MARREFGLVLRSMGAKYNAGVVAEWSIKGVSLMEYVPSVSGFWRVRADGELALVASSSMFSSVGVAAYMSLLTLSEE